MESNSQYCRMDYWDERFKTEQKFEWLSGLDAFQHIVTPLVDQESRIAHIGCGSSHVYMQLYNLGYENITNIDYSQVLIENGRRLHPYMTWIADDITTLANCESASFDVVFEKATIEAVLVTEKSAWEPSDEALRTLESIFSSISRVLKPNGMFISVSFTQPHFRIPALLRQKNWSVEMFEFGENFHYYVYVCRKGTDADNELARRYTSIAKSWLRPL
uniref:Methyltransf_11 domain-containing protein n=1 Tax=Caenorhabditis japonica TaxID=281687 RepID=A0A8R1E242_CAEJA